MANPSVCLSGTLQYSQQHERIKVMQYKHSKIWLQSSSKRRMTINIADCCLEEDWVGMDRLSKRVCQIASVSVSRLQLWFVTTWVDVVESLPCWMQPDRRDTTDIGRVECGASTSWSWKWMMRYLTGSQCNCCSAGVMCDLRSRLSTSSGILYSLQRRQGRCRKMPASAEVQQSRREMTSDVTSCAMTSWGQPALRAVCNASWLQLSLVSDCDL